MRRQIPGLHQQTQTGNEIPDGFFLVRVELAFYRYHPQKPFFALRLAILEPEELAGRTLSGRLYCTARALWKLNWFLQDFGYDAELLDQDVVDEKALLGRRGVVRVSHANVNGRCYLNLDGFAPAEEWVELSATPIPSSNGQKDSDDL